MKHYVKKKQKKNKTGFFKKLLVKFYPIKKQGPHETWGK